MHAIYGVTAPVALAFTVMIGISSSASVNLKALFSGLICISAHTHTQLSIRNILSFDPHFRFIVYEAQWRVAFIRGINSILSNVILTPTTQQGLSQSKSLIMHV